MIIKYEIIAKNRQRKRDEKRIRDPVFINKNQKAPRDKGALMEKELIKVRDLVKCFQLENTAQTILDHIDCAICKGDFTVIMGTSGSGKSTLLYALSGMDTVTEGQVIFGGTDITKLSSDEMAMFRRNHCGFIFQQRCLIGSMNVLNNVLAAGLLKKGNKEELVKRSKELLCAVGIEEHTWKKYPTQISGGKGARVGIVRALINEPEVLFADEPTGSLNSKSGEDVLDLFTEFNNKGQTIVMVTHDIKSALRGNRILYLKDGKIVDELFLGPYKADDELRKEKLDHFLDKMKW